MTTLPVLMLYLIHAAPPFIAMQIFIDPLFLALVVLNM